MKTNVSTSRSAMGVSGFLKFAAALCAAIACAVTAPSPTHAQTADSVSANGNTRVPSRITQAIDEKQLTRLAGNVHPLANARFDQGAVVDSQPMNRMLLVLKRSSDQEAALRQLLEDQLTLNSPRRHAWLTPQQFGAQFGPSDADIQATTNWLSSKGFNNIKVGAGRTTIEFSGTAGQVRDAFHTQIHSYTVKGEVHSANVSDPQIPAALSPVVAGIVSLHNFPRKSHSHTLGTFRRAKEGGTVQPLFSFAGCGSSTGGECNALGPADVAKIYNIPSNLDGTGQTIAIVGDSNIDLTDVSQYRSMFGLPTNQPTVVLNGQDPGITGDEGEADLDVQLAGGIAPNANVQFVISETTLTAAGIDLSALYVIDNNLAGVMSESFGGCESGLGTGGNQFYNELWEQAAAQGITVLVSTGDDGSANCDDPNTSDFATQGLAISGISSTPFNVAVGGTDFNYSVASPSSVYWNVTNSGTPATESAKSYIPEIPWNDSCAFNGLNGCTAAIVNANSADPVDLVAASGGPSSVYAKPSWQSGITGMPNDSHRDTPDVSLFASNGENNSFYVVCQKDASMTATCDINSPFQDFTGVGGTSASVQAMAGIMALINQSQANGPDPAPRQGNANYIFYKLYKTNQANNAKVCVSNPAAATTGTCLFYDITTGNISVACQGGTPNCSNTSTANNQFGVLATSGTPSWTATAGYDLASGLGSINVSNLVTAWSTAGLTATTTAITASPSSALTHGSNANFTVHVAAGAGTPTGQVSLIATPASAAEQGIGPFSLSSGTATFSTNLLPGGTAYNVVAHYSGDGTFAQSDSAPVTVTVNKESSKTTVATVTFDAAGNVLSSDAHSLTYGTPYILRIDVTNSAGTQCSANIYVTLPINAVPCPTGNVTFTDNGSAFNDFLNTNTGVSSNTVALTSQGHVEDQFINLTGGAHSIVATYAGDNSYTGSTSAADAVTVSKAATSITASAPATATTTSGINITATVATQSNGLAPTGSVTFNATVGGHTSALGSANLVGTNYDPNTGNSASGTATLSTTLTTAGVTTITATYVGDTNYTGSGPSTAVSVNVTSGTAGSFSVTASAVTITAGASGASTITVTPSGGFTGTVQVSCGSTLPPGVTCTPVPLSINVTGGAATGQLTISVAAPSSSLSALALPVRAPFVTRDEDAELLAAAVSTKNSYAPRAANTSALSLGANSSNDQGWLTLSAGTGLSAFALLLFPGILGRKRLRAAISVSLLCLVSLTLGCGGGSSSSGGGGGGTTKASTTTTLAVNATKLATAQNNFAFTVTVTSTGSAPTGQVQLFDGSTAIGTATSLTNGTVAINTGIGAIGTHSISAHYLGDTKTNASSSGMLNLTVTGATTVPITTSPSGSASVSLTIQ
jgi:pro-kumamolisin-like protein/Big-like domain-containing protein